LLSETLIAAARLISAATLQAAACWGRLRLAGSEATCSGAGMLLAADSRPDTPDIAAR
jgi:hypothetical protein